MRFSFKWIVNDSQLASYSFDPSHTFPRNISVRADSGIEVQITDASVNQNNTATYNIISILRSGASTIRRSRVRCQNNDASREIVIGDTRGRYVQTMNMV